MFAGFDAVFAVQVRMFVVVHMDQEIGKKWWKMLELCCYLLFAQSLHY